MPVCQGCGGSYDDKFKFCPYCGRAKPAPESIKIEVNVSSEDRWETCQIYRRIKRINNVSIGDFWAEAIGPNGKFVAGETPPFLVYHSTQVGGGFETYQKKGYSGEAVAHNFLVQQLYKDGWDALATPANSWEIHFRRKVRENNPKPWKLWITYIYPTTFYRGYFTLCRLLDNFKEKSPLLPSLRRPSITPQLMTFGKSEEFYAPHGEEVWNRTIEHDEERRVFAHFLQEIDKSFQPVDDALNEHLKKCVKEKPDKYLWCYRVFMKCE